MNSGGISLMDVLIVLARRKRLIAISIVVAGCLATLIAFLIPNRYTATAVILPPQSASASSALMAQLSNMGAMASAAGDTLGIKNPNDLYVALLRLEPVEDAMVQKFDLQTAYRSRTLTDARKDFEKHSDIMNGVKDGLIRISVTDTNSRRAAAMANAYVAEFQKFSRTNAITEAAQRRVFFEQQLVQAKDNLDSAEIDLKKTEQTKGVVQLGGQAMALIQSASSLRAQIAMKQVQVRAMRSYAGDKNSELLVAEQQLAGWQAQLARLTGNRTGTGDDLLLSRGQVPEAELDYAKRLRDVKYYGTVFDILARQLEMAKLDEAREGSQVQIMAPAIVPDKKSGPPRMLIVLGAMFAAFFLVSLYVVLSAGFNRIYLNDEQRSQVDELAQCFRGRA